MHLFIFNPQCKQRFVISFTLLAYLFWVCSWIDWGILISLCFQLLNPDSLALIDDKIVVVKWHCGGIKTHSLRTVTRPGTLSWILLHYTQISTWKWVFKCMTKLQIIIGEIKMKWLWITKTDVTVLWYPLTTFTIVKFCLFYNFLICFISLNNYCKIIIIFQILPNIFQSKWILKLYPYC